MPLHEAESVADHSSMYDCVSLGEVMLRFDPGEARIRTAKEFRVWEGGGEYNVTRGLSKCFGWKTAVITSIVDNEIGHLIEDLIMQGGVDTRLIKWIPEDGLGRLSRNGLNFVERGFGIRSAKSVSDRGNTAASQLKRGDIDWDFVFGTLGTRWFHASGIFTSLSRNTAELVLEAVQTAKKHGVTVSFDINYRPSLWKGITDKRHFQIIQSEIAKYVDVLLGPGFDIVNDQKEFQSMRIDGYIERIERTVASFPNIKVIVATMRQLKSANRNDWSAVGWKDQRFVESVKFQDLDVYDRVGGGDGFASGLIYGLLTTGDVETALNYGIAHGALTMTTPGDNSMVNLQDVESVLRGNISSILR